MVSCQTTNWRGEDQSVHWVGRGCTCTIGVHSISPLDYKIKYYLNLLCSVGSGYTSLHDTTRHNATRHETSRDERSISDYCGERYINRYCIFRVMLKSSAYMHVLPQPVVSRGVVVLFLQPANICIPKYSLFMHVIAYSVILKYLSLSLSWRYKELRSIFNLYCSVKLTYTLPYSHTINYKEDRKKVLRKKEEYVLFFVSSDSVVVLGGVMVWCWVVSVLASSIITNHRHQYVLF